MEPTNSQKKRLGAMLENLLAKRGRYSQTRQSL
jgi:hypothetical protein